MEFTKSDIRMFEAARKEAEKSTFDRFHIGCVIVYKGRIISRGHNSSKTHPYQRYYNRYRKFNMNGGRPPMHALHAETSAIVNIPYVVGKDVDFSKAKIYIYRIAPGKPHGMGRSKPCCGCLHALRDLNLTNIYYSDDFGYSYLKLD